MSFEQTLLLMHYTFTYKVLLENRQVGIKKTHFNLKHY